MILLTVVMLLGLGLRGWHFGRIAPSNPDEAMYLRQGRFMKTLALKTVGVDVPVVDATKEGIWQYVRKSDWYDKPCWLHSAFIAGWMLVLGETDAAGAANSLLFSMATVVLVYLVGRRIQGAVAGLVSALFLSVSGYWLLYSRSMWAEVDSTFFVLLAFFLLLQAGKGGNFDVRRSMFDVRCSILPFLAGASAALAVLCHYRLLYIIAPLGAVAVLTAARGPRDLGSREKETDGKRRCGSISRSCRASRPGTGVPDWFVAAIVRCALLLLGFVGVLCVVAGILRLAAMAIGPDAPFSGLIGALLERFAPQPGGVKQTGFQPGNALAYLYYLVRNSGWAVALAALAGIASLRRSYSHSPSRQSSGAGPVCLMLVFPLLVLCAQMWVVARAGAVMIPFWCLLGGVGVGWLAEVGDRRLALNRARRALVHGSEVGGRRSEVGGRWAWGVAVLVIVVAAGENLALDVRIGRNEMGHRRVAAFLVAAEPGRLYADPESMVLYNWYAPGLAGGNLHALDSVASGDHVVFDAQKYHTYPESTARITALERGIAQRADQVLSVPNLTTLWPEMLLDGTQAHSLRDMRASLRNAAGGDITSIRVYRLR